MILEVVPWSLNGHVDVHGTWFLALCGNWYHTFTANIDSRTICHNPSENLLKSNPV